MADRKSLLDDLARYRAMQQLDQDNPAQPPNTPAAPTQPSRDATPLVSRPAVAPKTGDTADHSNDSTVSEILSMMRQGGNDLGIGVAKGAGSTAESLGEMVHKIPYVGSATDAIGNYLGGKYSEAVHGTVAEPASFGPAAASAREQLEPEGLMQQIGKTGEQAAEFMVPAGAARKAAVRGAVTMIPNSLSPSAMSTANKIAAILGRSTGEAASAYGVAKTQGDPHAGVAAGLGATAPFATPIAEAAVKPLAAVAPYIGASILGGELGGIGGAIGSPIAMRYTLRNLLRHYVTGPNQQAVMQSLIRHYGPDITRLLIGGESQVSQAMSK